uniref:Uncharacterized protein n=1 Tax=mine drainage metagenome TaxID=410659 RepID=E6QQZ6_9ZZZZ
MVWGFGLLVQRGGEDNTSSNEVTDLHAGGYLVRAWFGAPTDLKAGVLNQQGKDKWNLLLIMVDPTFTAVALCLFYSYYVAINNLKESVNGHQYNCPRKKSFTQTHSCRRGWG